MRRPLEVTLSALSGVLFLTYGIVFLAGIFVDLPEDEVLNELQRTLGEEGFLMFKVRNTIAGMVGGVALLLVSQLLIRKPEEKKRWGAMVIILSSITLLGMGFFNLGILPGAILGIAGGALAIKRGMKVSKVPELQEEPVSAVVTSNKELQSSIIYRCSECGINFNNDEELRKHVIRLHWKD